MLIKEWDRLAAAVSGLPSDDEEALFGEVSDALMVTEPASLAHVFAVAFLTYDRQAAGYGAAGEFDAERGVQTRIAALCDLARAHGMEAEIPNALAYFTPPAPVAVAA